MGKEIDNDELAFMRRAVTRGIRLLESHGVEWATPVVHAAAAGRLSMDRRSMSVLRCIFGDHYDLFDEAKGVCSRRDEPMYGFDIPGRLRKEGVEIAGIAFTYLDVTWTCEAMLEVKLTMERIEGVKGAFGRVMEKMDSELLKLWGLEV
jgi:hypothetical protein